MKKQFLLVVMAFALLSLSAFSADVTFNDSNLLEAVKAQYEAQVGVPLSDPPQDTELANSNFTTLDASYLGITDLTGLEACTSLVYLNLVSNAITDITPISGLSNLVYLMLGKNQITNITAITGLTNLQYLDIGINQISDISGLSLLTNLIGLNLGFGSFFLYDDFDPFITGVNNLDNTDLAVLNSLTNLEILSIGGLENITDISFLNSLNNLKQLWLGSNPINDWTPLGSVDQNLNVFFSLNCGLTQTEVDNYVANMTNITYIDEDNPGLIGLGLEGGITDLSNLDGLNPSFAFFAGLDISNIDVVQNWSNLYLIICAYTNITNINALSGLQNLTIAQLPGNNIGPSMFTIKDVSTFDSLSGLDVSENSLTNLFGIQIMPNLVALNASNNQINDISGLSDIGAPSGTLESLILSYNNISDISPLLNYTALNYVDLSDNNIENFGYLVDNEGIGDGDYIDISFNPVPTELCYLVDQLEEKVAPNGWVDRYGVCNVTITINVEGIGNVLPGEGANTVELGSDFPIAAFPQANSGYAFDHWEIWDDGVGDYVLLTDSYNYYLSGVQKDTLLKAVFVPGTYILTFAVDPSSTGTGIVTPFYDGDGDYSFKENQSAFLYALPDPGSCFGGWTGDAQSFGYSPFANIVMDSNKVVGAIFSNQCYQLTIEVIGSGYTSPFAGTYQYSIGSVVSISAFPGGGYVFDHWEDGNNNNLGTDNPINVEITEDKTIRAIFVEIPTYSLTINVNGSGTTDPVPGVHQYSDGAVAVITATPDEGWVFNSWSGDIGQANPQDNPIQILMDADKVITANFLQTDHTVVITVNGPGTTDPAPGTYYYLDGQWAFYNAIPNAGKAFAGWYENDELVNSYPFYNFQVTSDRNLEARFTDPVYTIELSTQGSGTTNPVPGVYGYMGGEWLNYIAYPDPGWTLKYWITDNNIILGTDDLLILQVEESLSIIAVFEPCDWNVNITTAGTGTGDTDPVPGTYCYITGKQLSLFAQPAVDNYFGGWELVKNPLSNPETTWIYWFSSTVNIDSHYNMVAHFEDEGWNFDFQIQGDGVVVLGATDEPLIPDVYPLANNFPIQLTAVPNTGQIFKGWYSGDTLISTDLVFETNITDNLQLIAKFGPQVWYTLLINITEGQGTTSPNAGQQYLYLEGQTQVVRAIPANGWMFGAWTGDTEGIANIDQPEITVPMDRNRTIGVIFIQIPPEGEGTPEGTVEGEGTPEGTPEGTVEGEIPPHNADQNGDGQINLSELLRVIQFFNFGEYHCDAGSEDGYAPGPGDHSCNPHASDYNPQDWVISLSELLRLIQFFNSGGYYPCEGGEDGYCPGTQP